MYEAFFGLREKPFNLTPDPKYLYLSDKHKEAFAHLLFGIKNHTGFVMVTGEIGTGKTTICRNLLNQLEPDTELAFVFNPSLNPIELLKRINSEFGIDTSAGNVLELTDALNAHLLDAAAKNKSCVLVIDEAQNLTPPVLEQIRLLSNLETETEKLLQIILIGQPELLERLQLKELRQLNQRITARYHLKPLNEQETLQYIAYRLHVAGGRRKVQFARAAIRAVYKQSGGTPRVINAICDRALLIGYTKETHVITAAIVKRAAREIRGERAAGQRAGWKHLLRWMPSPALFFAVVIVAALVRFFAMPLENAARELGMFNTLLKVEPPLATPPTADPTALAGPAESPGAADKTAEQMAALLQNSAVAQRVLERLAALSEPAPKTDSSDDTAVRQLAVLDPGAARAAAAGALLRAWNMALVSAPPADDTIESLAEFARQNGLAYEPLTPVLEQLAAVDLPAFVRMTVQENTFWMALLAVDANRVQLSGGAPEALLDISRDLFRKYFAGEAIVLWRDPYPDAPVLSPGRSGKAVADLKGLLRLLGRLPQENTSDAYDGPTAMAVSRIQAETGLRIDGIAGKQVRMILASWAPDVPGPALKNSEPAPLPAPESPPATATAEPAAPAETLPPSESAVAAPPESPKATAKKARVKKNPPPEETAPAPEPAPDIPNPPAELPQTPETSPAPTPEASETGEENSDQIPMASPPAPANPSPEAASTPPAADQSMIQVQELPKPSTPGQLPPLDSSPLKESTAPAPGPLPLVPHGQTP